MGKATYIPTPCIRVCRLNEESVCVGCLRHADEIKRWPDADLDERIAILDQISERSKTIAPQY